MSENSQRFILAGGPGAGKTAVIKVLAEKGFLCIPDHARDLIKFRIEKGLSPRPEPSIFAKSILEMDVNTFEKTNEHCAPVFFERGIFDPLYSLYQSHEVTLNDLEVYKQRYPYSSTVFYFPPWAEIYVQDSERKHTYEHAVTVGKITMLWYEQLGFKLVEVPRRSPNERLTLSLRKSTRMEFAYYPFWDSLHVRRDHWRRSFAGWLLSCTICFGLHLTAVV